MKLKMLQPIVGTGDVVEGFRHQFSLEVGMTVEVESGTGLKWIESGIARSADGEEPATTATPEIATLQHSPERAARVRPVPRGTGKARNKS